MSEDRTGRELEPRPRDGDVAPREHGESNVERFYAGDRAHTVGLTEERAATIVRQSGNARSAGFLVTLLVVLSIPLFWFYDLGFPAVADSSRLEKEADAQFVTDVARGYELYLANCAQCHGAEGKGGIGPPLNDQAKLYNALTPDGLSGTGHLNPDYLGSVMRVGGRLVCGDPNSLMPAWEQPAGPLNYRQVEELIAFLTAPNTVSFDYRPAHAEGNETLPPPRRVTAWRDPDYKPAPGQPTPPACWRNPSGQIGGGGGGGGAPAPSAAVASPGTAEAPRVIKLDETATLQIVEPGGAQVTTIPVKEGETVRFEVSNSANFPHNFYIGSEEDLQANARGELEGIPDFNSGTQSFTYTFDDVPANLQFACIVPGHYGPMHGTFQAVP